MRYLLIVDNDAIRLDPPTVRGTANRMTAAFPPDVRHRNLERLVVEVVRSAIDKAGKRLLLVIEDAQWMNQLSMKLILKVGPARRRLGEERPRSIKLGNCS